MIQEEFCGKWVNGGVGLGTRCGRVPTGALRRVGQALIPGFAGAHQATIVKLLGVDRRPLRWSRESTQLTGQMRLDLRLEPGNDALQVIANDALAQTKYRVADAVSARKADFGNAVWDP